MSEKDKGKGKSPVDFVSKQVNKHLDRLGNFFGLTEEPPLTIVKNPPVEPVASVEAPTRSKHFEQGKQEHLRIAEKDKPHARALVAEYAKRGEDPVPFTKGNVESILNAYEKRQRKVPPKGY